MIAPDHTCWWTRQRQSYLSRRGGRIVAAGLSRPVLEAAARQLGYTLTLTVVPEQDHEDDETVTLGPWRGNIHDGCFLSFESDDPRLREALLAASLELHSFYLGMPVQPGCVDLLKDRLIDGVTIRLQSVPKEGHLILKCYRNAAGWWKRFTTHAERVC